MRYESKLDTRGTINRFPDFTGERVYMRPFFKRDGLPADLTRWQDVVGAMLDGVETDLPIYLMIDQKQVGAGEFHRRPGLHIDGYWGGQWGAKFAHGGDGGMPSHHRPSPGHSYTPPEVDRHRPSPGHGSQPPDVHRPSRRHGAGTSNWGTSTFYDKEAIILASNVSACRAYEGEFNGPVGEGGDCAHIDTDGLQSVTMDADRVYAGNVTMLHETLPCLVACQRTVVRLNVPGWSP